MNREGEDPHKVYLELELRIAPGGTFRELEYRKTFELGPYNELDYMDKARIIRKFEELAEQIQKERG